ncbi:MAG: efflux RND transporter permease subunit [Candidatus Omnitrophica bacterium]|nr:efflux RND transporter permease subunit [Candidatus Omnitrophota bacterium]
MGLPSIAIKRPVLTLMIFGALILLGVISLLRLPVELYQGRNQNIISIIVRARGGLPPVEVEKYITKPIEEAVSTVSHLKNLVSHSREAESRVTMEFEIDTPMRFAALEVREKFARVKPFLPKEIEKPVIANYDDAQSAVLVFALTSETLSPEEIRDLVDTDLKPILTRIDGVASLEVYGGRERKILVEMDRDKMMAYNISIEKVMDILGQSNINLLAGNVGTGKMELAIRTMGAFESVEEIGEIGIQATRQGSIIPLKEIATVKDSYLEPSDYARLNLEQNVTVYVKKESTAKTIPVVRQIRKVLRDFKIVEQKTVDIVIVTDKAEIIARAINDVKGALFIGMLLTVLLIYLFLRQWILALIVLLSIPASVITTFIFMDFLNLSLNVMTLSGLALAIGILVDSAVVILENIFLKKEQGIDDETAIRKGAEEMWAPLLGGLLTTLVVFLPIIFIDKKIQMLYAGFTFTVCISLICSFFVAQMLIPMLMMQWAKGQIDMEKAAGSEHFTHRLAEGYGKGMSKILNFRYAVWIGATLLFFFSAWRISKTPIDWPSALEENEFSIIVFPLAGAKLEANDDVVARVEQLLGKIPDVEMFSSAIRKDDVRIFVKLKPKSKRAYSKDEIMKLLDEKGNESIKQVHDQYSLIIDEGTSGSEEKKLVINLFGHENNELEKLAHEVAQRVSKIPGFANPVMTDLRKRPEYSLAVDKNRAALYGLSVRKIADSVHAQVRGMRPTKFHELTKGEEIETITRLQAIYRQKIEDLEQVRVAADTGRQIPLGEIANFYPSQGPQTIDRRDKYRFVFVKGDTKRPLEAVAKDVKEALRDLKMPEEYYWRFGGHYEELRESKSELSLALMLTFFLVYMMMACLFQSYGQPLLIMVSVPMASIGVWFFLAVTRKPLSEHVFIGMILLSGYVVNAAIIMMDRMNHLKSLGQKGRQILIQAGKDRLRPILMTTLSTCLGFLPMALNIGQSSDLWSPLAITVIGGLVSSTILTLFVLPCFILIAEEIGEKLKSALWNVLPTLRRLS